MAYIIQPTKNRKALNEQKRGLIHSVYILYSSTISIEEYWSCRNLIRMEVSLSICNSVGSGITIFFFSSSSSRFLSSFFLDDSVWSNFIFIKNKPQYFEYTQTTNILHSLRTFHTVLTTFYFQIHFESFAYITLVHFVQSNFSFLFLLFFQRFFFKIFLFPNLVHILKN